MIDRDFFKVNKSLPQEVYGLSDAETHNPSLVRVIRNTFFLITCTYELTPLSWRDFLVDCHRDLPLTVLDRVGAQTGIDLEWVDHPDISAGNDNCPDLETSEVNVEKAVRTYDDNLRRYFDDTCCQPVLRGTKPVVHEVNRHRFIAIATIIAAAFPGMSMHWPRHPVASNDNFDHSPHKQR
ncbi:MAG: hypothetical protein AAF234_13730 [Pseudomonadota bacterium]